jgi:large subunit ribosomal protein L18
MDHSLARRSKAREARAFRVRKKLTGTPERPRLSVSKTNLHIYAQLIDDVNAVTLAGVGTMAKEAPLNRKSKSAAMAMGKEIAQIAKKKNIHTAIFDRGRNKFHGVIAELAKGAEQAGLQFKREG